MLLDRGANRRVCRRQFTANRGDRRVLCRFINDRLDCLRLPFSRA
jgi:hypothetical protein